MYQLIVNTKIDVLKDVHLPGPHSKQGPTLSSDSVSDLLSAARRLMTNAEVRSMILTDEKNETLTRFTLLGNGKWEIHNPLSNTLWTVPPA